MYDHDADAVKRYFLSCLEANKRTVHGKEDSTGLHAKETKGFCRYIESMHAGSPWHDNITRLN